jgi:hypothetical protein
MKGSETGLQSNARLDIAGHKKIKARISLREMAKAA